MKEYSSVPFSIKLCAILVSIVIICYSAIVLESVIVPIFIGLLVALLLIPVCRFFERRLYLNRAIASIVVIGLFLLVVSGMFVLIGAQMSSLQDDWPAFQQQLHESISSVQQWIYEKFGVEQSSQMSFLEDKAASSLEASSSIIGQAFSSISSVIVTFFFSLLYAIFLLIYRQHILFFLVKLFGEKHKLKVMDIVFAVQVIVKKYLIGLIIQMVIVFVLCLIAFSILGIKYSFMLAIITGLLNVVPYIGVFTALLISVLITFATASTSKVLLVVIAYVVIHAIDGNFIMPKIVGSKVKVNSLAVIIGLVIGNMMWGIAGMLLAIPILAILKIICDRIEVLKSWGFVLGEDIENKKNNVLKEEDEG